MLTALTRTLSIIAIPFVAAWGLANAKGDRR